jgi:hypothetical protein
MSGLIEDPTFWVAVAFVIFVAAAFKKVRDGLNSALDGRAARIKAQLDEARQLREEAQAALAEYQRKVRDAAAEAKAIVESKPNACVSGPGPTRSTRSSGASSWLSRRSPRPRPRPWSRCATRPSTWPWPPLRACWPKTWTRTKPDA